MQGEIINVWDETWEKIWLPLLSHSIEDGEVDNDIWCALYSELSDIINRPYLANQDEIQNRLREDYPNDDDGQHRMRFEGEMQKLDDLWNGKIVDITNNPQLSFEAFSITTSEEISSEGNLIRFLENTYSTLDDYDGEGLANKFFNLLDLFLTQYNLRYGLHEPCVIFPTLPGIFSSLLEDLRLTTKSDEYLEALFHDFEVAFRDLRQEKTANRIKTCIQKQINLIEGLGRSKVGGKSSKFSDVCDKLDSWPHTTLKAALGKIYGFTSEYPGIRHSGTPKGVIRKIELRDLIAVSVMVSGFTPYLTDLDDVDRIFMSS